MISTDFSTNFEEDENFQNLRIAPTSLQILQLLKSNYKFTKNTNDFLVCDLKTLAEYEYYLSKIGELLAQLQQETSNCEKYNLSFPSFQNKSHASASQNLIVSEAEIPFSELKINPFEKGQLNERNKTFLDIKSFTNSKMLYSDKSDFNFPCKITSCVCGKRNERKSSQESKISKIFSTFNMKEHISKSSLNTESFNQFSQSQICSETNLESTISPSCKCTEDLNKTPINIQLSMDAAGDSNSPLTIVVEVPSTVLEVLQRKVSKINNSESLSTLTKSRNPKPRRSRLKSLFLKLFNNRGPKSCTSASTIRSSSFVKSEIFSSDTEFRENPVKDVNPYDSFSPLSAFSQIHIAHRTSDVLKTEFCNSDVDKISADSIIEKHYYDNKPRSKMSSQKEVKLTLEELYNNFLENQFKKEWNTKLSSEEGNKSLPCSKCQQNFKFPIDIKIIKFPLMLKQICHNNKDKTNLQNEKFLEMLYGTLPEELLNKRLVDKERRFGLNATFLANDKSSILETATLEYLLQKLANISEKKDINMRQPAEKDWHQTLSTRQLSKISLCSSGNCSCSVKDEYDSEVIEIIEEDINEKNNIKLSIAARLHRLTFNVFRR